MKLIQASAEQKIQRDQFTFEAWGERLSMEQFLKRERTLRQEPWCQKSLITWILEDEQGRPLASCETYETPSYLNQTEGKSLGMASVYTEPAHRKRGYAAEMISRLIKEVRSSPKGYQAIFCYSEIGADYYEKLGFRLVPSEEWVFESKIDISYSKKPQGILRDQLKKEDISCLVPPSSEFKFCIWPSIEQLHWYFSRQDLYGEFLHPHIAHEIRSYEIGAKINQSSIVWAADYKYDVLRVLLFHAKNSSEARDLMMAAAHHAQKLGLPEVRIWADPLFDLWASEEPFLELAKKELRSDALAMVCPLVSELKPLDWGGVSRGIWV